MRKCGCFMAPPAGLKTLKRRPSGLFVRPKQTAQENPLSQKRPLHDVLRFS